MTGIPEWVHVWGWLRQRGFRQPLPQQLPHVDPREVISQSDYDLAAQAWRDAGSPPVWKTYGGVGKPSPDSEPVLPKPSLDDLLGVKT